MQEIIRLAIEAIIKNMTINGIVWGVASEITDTTCTIKQDGRPDIENVILNAFEEVEDSYFTVVPKDGSIVLAGIIEGENHKAVVLKCTEVAKIIWKCGDKPFTFDDKEMIIHGGSNGGLPISGNVVERLNKLENFVNQFVTIYNTHTHPYVNVAAPATTSVSTGVVSGTLLSTAVKDIENTKVQH